MFVREVMTRHAATVGADETLEAAARKMKELGVGALPVLERGQLTGIVTDRDVAVRGVAAGADPRRARVRDAMQHLESAARLDPLGPMFVSSLAYHVCTVGRRDELRVR